MKRSAFAVILSLVTILVIGAPGYSEDLVLNHTPVKVLFSPGAGCTQAIIDQINSAKKEILVQAYLLTSRPIAEALVQAHKRAVKVEILLDKSKMPANHSTATFLARSGIPTFVDGVHTTAHNKVMTIDGETIITGSFNFTKQAEEKNAENLLIIKSEEMTKLYRDNWEKHKEHSEAYKRWIAPDG